MRIWKSNLFSSKHVKVTEKQTEDCSIWQGDNFYQVENLLKWLKLVCQTHFHGLSLKLALQQGMDLSVHQYFCVFFIKIWLHVYFKGRVGMILVVQVKDIKTFCKLPQNEALQKYETHSCGLLRHCDEHLSQDFTLLIKGPVIFKGMPMALYSLLLFWAFKNVGPALIWSIPLCRAMLTGHFSLVDHFITSAAQVTCLLSFPLPS